MSGISKVMVLESLCIVLSKCRKFVFEYCLDVYRGVKRLFGFEFIREVFVVFLNIEMRN